MCLPHNLLLSIYIFVTLQRESIMCKIHFLSRENGSPVFSVRMFEREFCSNSSFACGLFHLNGADLYFNTKHINFFKGNLLVLNFAHHLPIVANNSQSSDYGLCHNYTAEVQQVISVQTKLSWKTVILKMIKIYLECTWIVSTTAWYSCSECMIIMKLPTNPAYRAMPNFHLWLLMHPGLSPTTLICVVCDQNGD